MAEKETICQLEHKITTSLNITSSNQRADLAQTDERQSISQGAHSQNKKKRQNRKKKSAVQIQTASMKESATVLESNSPKNLSKTEGQTGKIKLPKTKEYLEWESQKKQLIKQGLYSSTYLNPAPKKFVSDEEVEDFQSKRPGEASHNQDTAKKCTASQGEAPLPPRPQTVKTNIPSRTTINKPVDQTNCRNASIQDSKGNDLGEVSNKTQNVSKLEKPIAIKEGIELRNLPNKFPSPKAPEEVSSRDAITSSTDVSSLPSKPANTTSTEDSTVPEGYVRIVLKPAPVANRERKKKTQSVKPTENKEQPDASEETSKSSTTSSEGESRNRRPDDRILVMDVPKSDLDHYRRSGILPLKHISDKFPRAFFHCRLCSFHISSLPEVGRHLKDPRHQRLQAVEHKKQTATLIPTPSAEVTEVIGDVIQNIYETSRISNQEMETRIVAFDTLKMAIEQTFTGYTVRLFGSTFTGLGLRFSDVNLGLIKSDPSSEPTPGLMIIQVLIWLQRTPIFSDISSDFNCREPFIQFRHRELDVQFKMIIDGENAYKTSVLLKEYTLIDERFAILTVAFRLFARICQLDKPDLGTLPSHAFTLLVLHYLQQAKILPVLHKNMDDSSYFSAKDFIDNKKSGKWKPQNKSLGQLWLGLLRFYASTFHYGEHTVCVRTDTIVTRSSKNWGNRRLAIEDPFHTNVNLGSSLGTRESYEFFLECLGNIFTYFWIPRTSNGPLFTRLVLPGEGSDGTPLVMTPAEAKESMARLNKEDLKWDFTADMILQSNQLPLTCSICNENGHSSRNCPELEVPPVGVIPPPDVQYLMLLDRVCYSVFKNFCQSDKDIAIRESIRLQLEHYIRKQYPDAVLTLFGSSCNGFGFYDSDMDICLTFESNADGKDLDFANIVKKLGKMMRGNRSFRDIIPITSAKVPIVKMRHRETRLEADVSIYNQLGRRNSQLLATYAAIDPRVRILGYMAKLLAKQCDIGDASRGTLSSYAYTLMVLHYLQQITPPVVPVLQEIIIEGIDRSQYLVEGRDTWFFEDFQNLPRVWPHYGANRESPSMLWLGFLLYYAEVFNYSQQVVCIRQLKPLFRLEKMWTDRAIAIEDPFDLSHNLGSGISFRMGAYIRRVFVHARRLFQTPVRTLPMGFSCLEEYLFNPRIVIPSGPPPNDRGCNICGRIGHKVRDCDMKRGKRGKRNDHVDSDEELPQPKDQPRPAQDVNQGNKKPFSPRNQSVPNPIRHNRPPGQFVNRYRPPQPGRRAHHPVAASPLQRIP